MSDIAIPRCGHHGTPLEPGVGAAHEQLWCFDCFPEHFPANRVLAGRIEQFRKALMVAHAHDWDMDTIAEAAHVCAKASVR
jgi:hypothetical protein